MRKIPPISSENLNDLHDIMTFMTHHFFARKDSIRNTEPAWVKVNGSNFRLVDYKDKKGELRPCYQLTKTECLYIATKFNDEARAKLVIRWEELERTRMGSGA